jgi:hypothetical protein
LRLERDETARGREGERERGREGESSKEPSAILTLMAREDIKHIPRIY